MEDGLNYDEERIEFVHKLVKPFYSKGLTGSDVKEVRTALSLSQIEPAIVDRLLSAPSWRERIVAGWFCGLKGWRQYEGQIGKFLLESKLVYAGRGYCFALACFADATSSRHLIACLDYYLRHPEMIYDQNYAIGALMWIDAQRGTSDAAPFLEPGGLWETFAAGKNDAWHLDTCQKGFWRLMHYCRQNFAAP